MHVGVFQRLILERRVGKMPAQLRATGDQRSGGIRMRDGDGVFVQAVEVLVAPLFGSRVLQKARLH